MTQAARSAPANIAEGASRRDTSAETLMKLTDVSRATISELAYDYLSLILLSGELPWAMSEPDWKQVHDIRLATPEYSMNLMHDVGKHILDSKKLFDTWLCGDMVTAANAILVLCGRINRMINRQLKKHLDDYSSNGGFTENLTKTRIEIC